MRQSRLLFALFLFPLFTNAQAQWKSFTDTAGNFSAKYPPKWVNKIKEGNRVFFSSPADSTNDPFIENINIFVTSSMSTGTIADLKEIVSYVGSHLPKQLEDYKEESVRYFKWNGKDAAEIIFSGYNKLQPAIKVRSTQWYCISSARLFVMTYVAVDGANPHDADAKGIMNSVVFKKG